MIKKSPTAPGSFQEFIRTYVRPKPAPIENPTEVQTVCPLCARIYPAGSLSQAFPTCPECYSEAIEIGVQPLETFLASRTVEDLEDMLGKWEAAEGFLPEYKNLKADRIRHLKKLKLNAS